MAAKRRSSATRRTAAARRAILRRWLAVVALAACAFLYYRPVVNYLDTRRDVNERRAEVRALEAQRRDLERRLGAQTSAATLLRDARRLGFVKPGEQLFIVKGIPEWRRERLAAREGAGATIGADG